MSKSGEYSHTGAFKHFGPPNSIMSSSIGGNFNQNNHRLSISNHNSPVHRQRLVSQFHSNQTVQPRQESNLSKSMNSNINRLS